MKNKGFTLIELLAVITIMGILLLVAIPAVSRTIENSRKDTFVDVAQKYIDAVRNNVISGDLVCEIEEGKDPVNIAATGTGKYYYVIDSAADTELLESGGKSSYGGTNVMGYVLIDKTIDGASSGGGTSTDAKEVIKYSIAIRDDQGHGFAETLEGQFARPSVVLNIKTEDVNPTTKQSTSKRCKFKGQSNDPFKTN